MTKWHYYNDTNSAGTVIARYRTRQLPNGRTEKQRRRSGDARWTTVSVY